MFYKVYCLLLLYANFLLLVHEVKSNHYRGVVSTSEWLSNDLFYFKAQFYYRLKNNGGGSYVKCDDQMINDKIPTKDDSGITLSVSKCDSETTCGSTLFYLENSFICNSYSTVEDWSIVDKLERVNISRYNFRENDWIVTSLSTSQGQWSDTPVLYGWTHFSRKIKNKNDNWNNPPTTKTFPKYTIVKGCETRLKIPVDDIDGDIIKCRASLNRGPRGKECVNCDFRPAYLDQETCTLVFPSTITKSLIIEIQIEDFQGVNDTLPMSSVPLQFTATLITIANPTCDDYPIFTQAVPPDGSCVATGSQYSSQFEFNSTSNITELFVNAFDGFQKGSLELSQVSNTWLYDYSVKVNYSDVKQESLTVYAKNEKGFSTELRKINYLLNYEAPKVVDIFPLNEICKLDTGNYNWKFTVNRNASSPQTSSFVKFMLLKTVPPTLVYQYNMLTLNNKNFESFTLPVPTTIFQVNETYSILLDFGAIITLDYCKPQSEAITDLKQFQFKIVSDSANELIYVTQPPLYTNGSLVLVEWVFLTGKKTECLLKYEDEAYKQVPCNESSIHLSNLNSGKYSFYVKYSTKCSNSTSSESISWTVVKEKPVLKLTTQSLLNNHASNNFTVLQNCTHVINCQIYCKFSTQADSSLQPFTSCTSIFKPPAKLIHQEKYVFSVYANDKAGNTADMIEIRFTADTEAPVFIQSPPETVELNCGDSIGLVAVANIFDDVDPSPSLEYVDLKPNPCLTSRLWIAKDYLNNTSTFKQEIIFDSKAKLGYTDTISIPCVTNQQVIQDLKFYKGFITLENNLCNATLDAVLTTLPSLPSGDCDFTINIRWTIRDTCANRYPDVSQKVIVGIREIPYSPLHLQSGVNPFKILFKWPLDRNSNINEIYVRSISDDKATMIGAVRNNYLTSNYNLKEDTVYYWNVVYQDAKNASVKRSSPFWEFKTKYIADLALNNVKTPGDVTVGNRIQVTWSVKNLGNATTSAFTWSDAVYGSSFDDFSKSRLLGTVRQNRFVEPKGQYSADFFYEIPERYTSQYFYIFIVVDYYEVLEDSDNSNNGMKIPNVVQVLPVPLPNLVPKVISLNPDVAKAGEIVEIRITIENAGDGSTKLNSVWTDSIDISLLTNSRNVYKTSLKTTGVVLSKESYTIIKSTQLPLFYYGDARVACSVNIYDTLYEASLNNNVLSRNFTILPPDTPKLVIEKYPLNLTSKTGETILIEYSVKNDGVANTNEFKWTDLVRVVSVGSNRDVMSKRLDIYDTLKPGESYTRQVEFYLDQRFNGGNYKIIISSDSSNNVFSIFTNNMKTVEIPLFVELVKAKWSLKRFNATVLLNVTNTIEIVYDLTIEYPFKTSSELVWTDTYYISDRSKFDAKYAIKLGESGQKVMATSPNSFEVSVKKQLNVESTIYGKYNFYMFIDENELIDKVSEYTNPSEVAIQINKLLPILNITEFKILKDPSDEYILNVTWKIKNLGKVKVDKPQFGFFANLPSTASIQLGNYQYEETINSEESKELSTKLQLDSKLYGKIGISIKSYNTLESFYTIDKDSVNSTSISIQQPQSADLTVNVVSYVANLEGGQECNNNRFLVNITYTVQNIAYSMDRLRTWTDKVAVICDNGVSLASKSISITKQLWSTDSYTNSHQLLLTLTAGYYSRCRAQVNTNVDNSVLELFSLENNLKEKCCFSVPRKPEAKLVQNIFEPADDVSSWKAGEVYEIKYAIKNEGNSSKYSLSAWRDSVYLHRVKSDSMKNVLASGVIVGEKTFIDFELYCEAKSASNYTVRLQMPISLSGNYYLFLIHEPQTIDSSTILNSRFDINVIPIEPCDVASANGTLVTSSGNNFTGGDTVYFSFDVYNIASGKARGGWYDAVYLSKFPTVTSGDLRLITVTRKNELLKNEFYKMEFELKLPLTLASGAYFIVFVTDIAQVLPDLDRDNNQASIMLNIETITDADIFVTNVTMSQQLDFTWQLNADRALKAHKCDSIYLSLDNSFSYSDFELTNGFCEAFEIRLLPSNELSNVKYKTKVKQLPLLPDGAYYGIVRTITNVQETNLDNNAAVSENNIAIEVQELEINVLKEVKIKANQNNLFKFTPNVNMNTLRIELKTSSQTAYNDLFVSLNKIPTENSFVTKSRFPNSFNQSALMRNVKPDKYYLIIKSYLATSVEEEYSVSVFIKDVQEIDVEIVEPTKLSRLGMNTVKITGNFVPQKLEVCLMNSDQVTALCAFKVYKMNIEVIFATFDLSSTSLKPGEVYQISVNGKMTSQNVDIIAGVLGTMQVKLAISQNIYRPNETAYADVIVKNNGDTDINVPVIFFTTIDLQPSTTSPNIKPEYVVTSINGQSYPPYYYDNLIVMNTNNLGAVIQPRSSATLRFKIKPTSATPQRSKITVTPYEANFLLEYVKENIDSYKSNIYTDSAWKQLSQVLIQKIRENTRDILHETVNELTTNGVEFYRVSDLVAYHVSRLDGAFFTNSLIDSVEFSIFDNELAYRRSYSARFSSRNTRNVPTGLGWTDNLHLKLEKNTAYDSFLLTWSGRLFSIDLRSSNTTYFSDIFQIELSDPNTALITLKGEIGLVYEYDLNENCIRSIATANENKFISVSCRKGKIFEMYNSEVTIQFAYTSSNLLRTITRASLNAPKETFTLVYDDNDRIIEFTGPTSSTKYKYDSRSNLIEASTSSDVVLRFEYNSDGLINSLRRYEDSRIVSDYGYNYLDYGPIEVLDRLNDRMVKYFYDLNGRVLYYEENEVKRVNYISSSDLTKTTILMNGEILKRTQYDEQTKSVNQIYDDSDDVSSQRIVFSNETHETIEYSDRLKNKVRSSKQLVNNSLQIEELLLPNGLKETKTFDYAKNELRIQTRNNDDLTVKYDESSRRVFYSHALGDGECSFEYTSDGLLSSARGGKDDYASIVNKYDSAGRLVNSRMKNNYVIDYSYDAKSNLVDSMKTSEGMVFKYARDENGRVTAVNVNDNVLVSLNYSQSGYRLKLPEIARFFEYSYSSKTGQLMSYTIGDLQIERNSIHYEYEYNHKLLMKSMKLVTNQDDAYVSQYSYDNADRLVSVRNEKVNATFDIVYDSNGNRRSFVSRTGEQIEEYVYSLNQLNQYTSDGANFYTYDLNGNIISETDKSRSNVNSYNYYEDGKLSQFISKDDNCTLKYDCLERVSDINCTGAGLFIFNYQLSSQTPLSLKLPNATLVYFIYIPPIPNAVGFIMDNKTHYFEYNGQFVVQQILVVTPTGTVKPAVVTPSTNPFVPPSVPFYSGPTINSNGQLPVSLSNLHPTITPNTIISTNNKPLSLNHGSVLGQSVFNVDSILSQNSIMAGGLSKPPAISNPFQNINRPNMNNLKPPFMSPSPSLNPSSNSIRPPSNSPSSPSSPSSSVCDKFNNIFGLKKKPATSKATSERTKRFAIPALIVNEACEASGTFIKEYFIKGESFGDSLKAIAQNYKTLSGLGNIYCNGFTMPSLDTVLNNALDMVGDKLLDSALNKIPFIPNCIKKALPNLLPSLSDLFNWLFSKDPNDITGPAGYGANNYIANDQKFNF